MNRQELLSEIAIQTGVSKSKCDEVLSAFISTTVTEVKNGGTVTLVGFGTFSQTERAERKCIHPVTKEDITVSAKKVPHFKAGKAFKDALVGV